MTKDCARGGYPHPGCVLVMPSGYYDGYGSDHHIHWVWHTKSHNCVTLSDSPQIMDSHDAVGAVEIAGEVPCHVLQACPRRGPTGWSSFPAASRMWPR